MVTDGQVDLKASFAAGVVHDGKLFLTPISEAVSFRPQLKHLDKALEAKPGVKAEGAGDEAPSAMPVTVCCTLRFCRTLASTALC